MSANVGHVFNVPTSVGKASQVGQASSLPSIENRHVKNVPHKMPHLAVALMMAWTGCLMAADTKPTYPATRKDNVVEKIHGKDVVDPYRWLEDGNAPEVKEWTEKENALTKSILDKLPNRDAIHKRLGELLEIGRISAPQPAQGKYVYGKRQGTQNHAIIYVRDGMKGADRVLLDPNTLSKDGTVALDWYYVNDLGTLMAYGLSKDGSEDSVLHVRDVATGKDLPDQISSTRAASLAWAPDGKGFYYTRYPREGEMVTAAGSKAHAATAEDTQYYRHVFYHQLGTEWAKDAKVFGESREREDWTNVELSPDGRWLLVTVEQGWSRTEVYLKDLKTPGSKFVPVAEKKDALYVVTARNDALFVCTNEGASRYRVFRVDPAKLDRESWREIIKEGSDVLDGIAVVSDKLVALYVQNASSRLRVFDLDGKPLHEVKLPTLGSIESLGAEWNGKEAFYAYSSFTVPPSVYRLDLTNMASTLWERVDAKLNVEPFEVEQVKYTSKDGTPITMFLAHRKGLKLDGQNPVLLTGYGGFNVSETPVFGASLFLFLERGGVVALPNLRGGGEYGEAWHQAGMLDKKQNVFDDFLAAAEWLIAQKYTRSRRLAIMGGSNGGLLTGAALTQRPDLFRAVVCQVPLLDMLRYHKFRIARLWIPEYGDPDDPKEFPFLQAYSPYQRVKDGVAYPAVLFTAAESDTRVDPLHARKMAARLQAATSSTQPILLRLETQAGHGAGKPRSKIVDELTDEWSFLFWQLDVK